MIQEYVEQLYPLLDLDLYKINPTEWPKSTEIVHYIDYSLLYCKSSVTAMA